MSNEARTNHGMLRVFDKGFNVFAQRVPIVRPDVVMRIPLCGLGRRGGGIICRI